MQYCPHTNLDGKPNVIVSGTATNGTSLVLSPFDTGSPALSTMADTSAGIASYCQQERILKQEQFVSSDSFSVDALAGIFLLVDADLSVAHDILEALARMALYEYGADRDLAHVLFILNAWQHPVNSPLNAEMFKLPAAELANVLFEELLLRLPKIIEKIDHLERYWIDEEQKLQLAENLWSDGSIQLKELAESDLAIVNIAESEFKVNGRLFQSSENWFQSIHPIAIHNVTSCSRILLQSGQRRFFYYRADSLALFKRDSILPRKNLERLAASLSSVESGEQQWICDSITAHKPCLKMSLDAPSRLSDRSFEERLLEFFEN